MHRGSLQRKFRPTGQLATEKQQSHYIGASCPVLRVQFADDTDGRPSRFLVLLMFLNGLDVSELSDLGQQQPILLSSGLVHVKGQESVDGVHCSASQSLTRTTGSDSLFVTLVCQVQAMLHDRLYA